MSPETKTRLVVFGDQTADEVVESAQATGLHCDVIKIFYEERSFREHDLPELNKSEEPIVFQVGIADPRIKLEIIKVCEGLGWKPQAVIHPSAEVSPSARIAEGVFVAPLAFVSTNASVDSHSIIHAQSSIGHNATVGSCSAILPGARVSGNVTIGNRVTIGSNAFISQSVSIGDDAAVDALTYVRQDVPPGHVISVRRKGLFKRAGY